MTTVNKTPLSDFRASSFPIAGVTAVCTATAPTQPSQPPNSNWTPYLVVQDVTACLAAGTVAHPAIQVSLIDGTTGGTSTNVVWGGVLSGLANGYSNIIQNSLSIRCNSGYATLAFSTGITTQAQASVAMGGYYGGPNFN